MRYGKCSSRQRPHDAVSCARLRQYDADNVRTLRDDFRRARRASRSYSAASLRHSSRDLNAPFIGYPQLVERKSHTQPNPTCRQLWLAFATIAITCDGATVGDRWQWCDCVSQHCRQSGRDTLEL